jgi:ABC-type lipoprotein export system ATPase subunit
LSGGEQQRVAIARALVNGPQLLLADEPTGDLDERSAENVFELMQHLHKTHQLTSILATHNISIARRADRVLSLEHGKLASGTEALAGSTVPLPRTASAGAKTPGERG